MRRPQATIASLPRRRSLLYGGRLWIAALAAVALLLVGLIARDTIVRPAGQSAGLRTATVSRGTVRAAVTSTGTLVSVSQLNVNVRQPGQLTEVDVKVGDRVKAGQVLARLDSGSQQAALAQARASLASAQANLQATQSPLTAQQLAQLQHSLAAAQQNHNDTIASVNAQNNADATTVANDQQQLAYDRSLFDADGCNAPTPANQARCATDQANINRDQSQLSTDLSRQRMDLISGGSRLNQAAAQVTAAQDNLAVQSQVKPNTVAAAQAQLQSAQAQVQSAQTSLDQTTLTAPTDGVVVSINGLPGENVSAGAGATQQAPGAGAPQPAASSGSNAASSSTFMVISDPSNFLAVVPFAESDAARLKADQGASLTFDAVSGLTISGHLLAMGPNASVVSNVVNYYASFIMNRSDPRLRSGMTANVSVSVAEASDVLYVPNAAVRRQSGTNTVMTLVNGQQVATEVELGLTGDTTTEIKAGLQEGQRVVLPSLRIPSGQGGQRGFFGGAGGGLRGGPGG
jgi:multidrug efflux pump subunit AcrA (membrane-fusion protein)